MKIMISCRDGTKMPIEAEKVEVDGQSLKAWFAKLSELQSDFKRYEEENKEDMSRIRTALETNAKAIDKVQLIAVKTAGGK